MPYLQQTSLAKGRAFPSLQTVSFIFVPVKINFRQQLQESSGKAGSHATGTLQTIRPLLADKSPGTRIRSVLEKQAIRQDEGW